MSREIPTLDVRSWSDPFDGVLLSELSQKLPEFIAAQRWYRSKARSIKGLAIDDVVRMHDESSFILVIRIEYRDGDSDTYLLPLSLTSDGGEVQASDVVARLRGPHDSVKTLSNALSNPRFRNALLDAVACKFTFPGSRGQLLASRTSAFDRACGASEPPLESFVSRAEQSNSSIIFGTQYILKVFRKLEAGINPDLEIGRFLTGHAFKYTPAVLGEFEYRPAHGDAMYAAILQAFVKNQGDAWKYTLDSLASFFEKAFQSGTAPNLETYHPMQLLSEELPALARQTIGEYIESARLLGNRTALLHATLADPGGGPDFAPEEMTPEYAGQLHNEMVDQTETTLDLLMDKQKMLSGEAAENAGKLIAAQDAVRERFSILRSRPLSALRIRHHGDYHLGQVLSTGDDFIIIDFEGEPARPLAARRIKTLAMRDVAGMIRSFSYAGYAALFGQVAGVPTGPSERNRIEAWASFWGAWVSAEYLKSYFETARSAPFVGSDPEEHRILFDAFVLQKALYEVAYELNNRPDWVQIPLRGILALIS